MEEVGSAYHVEMNVINLLMRDAAIVLQHVVVLCS
jgi:hypothetical protein